MNPKIYPLLALTILALAIQGAAADEFIAGVEFQSRTGGGYLFFDDNFTASTVIFYSNRIIFFDFENTNGEFGTVGFDVPAGINITIIDVFQNSITQSAKYTSIATYTVYAPGHLEPNSVIGAADGWSWNIGESLTSMSIEADQTIVISWEPAWYVENDTYAQPTGSLPLLLNQYLAVGDISGFIISGYTMTMGIMFFPLVLLMFAMPSQQRLGVMMTAVIVILAWTTLEIALFPQAINLVNIIIRIGLAGTLVYLFFARRRQIG